MLSLKSAALVLACVGALALPARDAISAWVSAALEVITADGAGGAPPSRPPPTTLRGLLKAVSDLLAGERRRQAPPSGVRRVHPTGGRPGTNEGD